MSFLRRVFGLKDKEKHVELSPSLNQWFDSLDNGASAIKTKVKLMPEVSQETLPRKNYEDSCRYLQSIGEITGSDIPPIPKAIPRYDDEDTGFSFFRTMLEETDFSNLTLPRTYFGKSEFDRCSYQNTDLSESVMCWNDFIEVNFAFANLSSCDLRASCFERCSFYGADLISADLRLSDFIGCDFSEANMENTKLHISMKHTLMLSDLQVDVIDWCNDEGEEPDGG